MASSNVGSYTFAWALMGGSPAPPRVALLLVGSHTAAIPLSPHTILRSDGEAKAMCPGRGHGVPLSFCQLLPLGQPPRRHTHGTEIHP